MVGRGESLTQSVRLWSATDVDSVNLGPLHEPLFDNMNRRYVLLSVTYFQATMSAARGPGHAAIRLEPMGAVCCGKPPVQSQYSHRPFLMVCSFVDLPFGV